MWQKVNGILKQGHQVASGMATNSPYPKGTIEMQKPYFQELGLDLSPYFPGTLNISIHPHTFKLIKPEHTFGNLQWNPAYPAEDFSFSRCRVVFAENLYPGLVYYPHPETKIGHFQDPSTVEVIATKIPEIVYGDALELEFNSQEVEVK